MELSASNIKQGPLFYVRGALQNEALLSDVLCGFVVAGCFWLYLHYTLTHTLVYTEAWQRQYLIANHIARLWEFPSVGDELSVFYGLRVTSPVYYYLFGFVLWLHNSMLFAEVVWLSLSMLAIVCVYLLAKDLFSPVVGLFACALFGFSFTFAQPLRFAPNISVGQALLYFSFLFLARAYKRKDFTLLLWAIAAYCLAGVLYSGAFGVLPVFAVLAGLTLKSQHQPVTRYFGGLAVAGLVLLAAYLPLVIPASHAHESHVGPSLSHRFVYSPRTFLKDMLGHAIYAADTLFLVESRDFMLPPLSDYSALARQFLFIRGQTRAEDRVPPRGEAAGLVFVALAGSSAIAYLFLKNISPERKRHAGILACGISAVLFSAALFNFFYHAMWHYMAIEGLLCILVAETVYVVCARLVAPRGIELIFICPLIWCCAGGFAGISMLVDRPSGKSASPADAAGAAIVRETIALRQASDRHLRPQIKRYGTGGELSNDSYLWIYMENAFNEPFVKLTDILSYSVFQWYEPAGDDRYVFVVCPHQARPQDCRDNFLTHYRQYAIVKDIIANDAYDIVLAKRI